MTADRFGNVFIADNFGLWEVPPGCNNRDCEAHFAASIGCSLAVTDKHEVFMATGGASVGIDETQFASANFRTVNVGSAARSR
jgi:hypothetical protein